jgi:5-methylcytosine-specific restriction endonuclease McrA
MNLSSIDPKKDYGSVGKVWRYVYERDLGTCQITGKAGEEVHHIVFKSQGGDNSPRNLVLLSKEGHMIQHGLISHKRKHSCDELKERVRKNERVLRRRLV